MCAQSLLLESLLTSGGGGGGLVPLANHAFPRFLIENKLGEHTLKPQLSSELAFNSMPGRLGQTSKRGAHEQRVYTGI